MARTAHPRRVRRGLRCACACWRGRLGVWLRAPASGQRLLRGRRRSGARVRQPRCGGDHRGRPWNHGGCEQGGARSRWHFDWLQHRAPSRAGFQRIRESERRRPLLLRAQDHVREVLDSLRRLPGRVRNARRAFRVSHSDSDREDRAVPGRPVRERLLGRTDRLDSNHNGHRGCAHRRRGRSVDGEDDPIESCDLVMDVTR